MSILNISNKRYLNIKNKGFEKSFIVYFIIILIFLFFMLLWFGGLRDKIKDMGNTLLNLFG